MPTLPKTFRPVTQNTLILYLALSADDTSRQKVIVYFSKLATMIYCKAGLALCSRGLQTFIVKLINPFPTIHDKCCLRYSLFCLCTLIAYIVKHYGTRSDCFLSSSLIRVQSICFHSKVCFDFLLPIQLFFSHVR